VPETDSSLALELTSQLRRLCGAAEHLSHTVADSQHLHLTDFRALILITGQPADQPMTAGQLAQSLSLSSGAVTYLVERLVQAGHVTRDVDPADRRKVLLVPTEQGRTVADNFFAPLHETLAPALSGVSEAQARGTLKVLEAARQAIEDVTERTAAHGKDAGR